MESTHPSPTRRRSQLIAQLIALLLAVALAVGAGADFSTTTVNPDNVFSSGILDHSNSLDGAAILTAENMWPGQTVEGEVTIANVNTEGIAGRSLVSTFTLDEIDVESTFRPEMLTLVVHDMDTDVEIYSGDLGGLGSVELEPFQPDEERTYKFTVTFSEDAENDLDEGKDAVATYRWTQVPTRVEPGS